MHGGLGLVCGCGASPDRRAWRLDQPNEWSEALQGLDGRLAAEGVEADMATEAANGSMGFLEHHVAANGSRHSGGQSLDRWV
jgi:hypothetical protein